MVRMHRANYPSSHLQRRSVNVTTQMTNQEREMASDEEGAVGAVTVFALIAHPVLKSVEPAVVHTFISEHQRYEPKSKQSCLC